MDYLSVKNFHEFQHYKDRKPPWIKLYRSLLSDRSFFLLRDVSKWHLIGLFILASQEDNRIDFDIEWIKSEIKARERINWDELFESGFIILNKDASIMLADCKQNAPLVEKSREEKRQSRVESASASKRASAPPDDFPVTDVLKEWASKNVPGLDVEAETAKFLDHHRSKGTLFKDWNAAWRKWMRNAAEWGQARTNVKQFAKPQPEPDPELIRMMANDYGKRGK